MLTTLLILLFLAVVEWVALIMSNSLIIYIADIATAALIVYLIVRVRTKTLKREKEKLLERIAELESKLEESKKE